MIIAIIGLVAGAVIGLVVAATFAHYSSRRTLADAQEREAGLLEEADRQRREIIEQARVDSEEFKQKAQEELRERDGDVRNLQRRLSQKGNELDKRKKTAQQIEQRLDQIDANIQRRHDSIREVESAITRELAVLAGTTPEAAATEILETMEQNLAQEARGRLKEMEAEFEETVDEGARRLLEDVTQRLAGSVVSESSIWTVSLSEKELSRALSMAGVIEELAERTGTSLSLSEENRSLHISASDPVNRELAKNVFADLLRDGRGRGRRLGQFIEKRSRDLEKAIRRAGSTAIKDAGCRGLPRELADTFGRLAYRYSYGQNQLHHAVETAHLAAMLARELGADVEIARAGGLLHDLGKSIDRDTEGTHAAIGARLALEAGVDERIAHCIEAHHEEIEPASVEAIITIVADAISGSRPGARRESLEHYLKRLEALEEVANAFPGVEKSYAIQAGREIRIMVKPEEVDDLGAQRMAKEISKSIQESLDYPGQVKVTVIRERRSIEYAK